MTEARCWKCFAPATFGESPGATCDEHKGEVYQPAPSDPPFTLERGKVYESHGPNGQSVMVMTPDTWTDFGTNMQTLRQAVSHLNRQLKEAHINERVLLARLTDRENRLENLRAVRRAEKRPEVEAMISSPNESTPTEG